MKLKFHKKHNYGQRLIKAGEEIDIPDSEALYMIRMGLAISVDEGEKEKVEFVPAKEKVEFKPVKEKRERKPRAKK